MNTGIEILTDEECAMVKQVVPDRSHEDYRDIYDDLLEDMNKPSFAFFVPLRDISFSPQTPPFQKSFREKIFSGLGETCRKTYKMPKIRQFLLGDTIFLTSLTSPYFGYFKSLNNNNIYLKKTENPLLRFTSIYFDFVPLLRLTSIFYPLLRCFGWLNDRMTGYYNERSKRSKRSKRYVSSRKNFELFFNVK